MLATRLFVWAGASYGVMRTDGEFRAQHSNPNPGDSFLGMRPGKWLPGVYYANFFGSDTVSFFGEQRLTTCPAVRNEPFENGAWLITTARDPWQWQTPAALALKQAVRQHLGERAFFEIRNPDRPTIHPIFDFTAVRVGTQGGSPHPQPLSSVVFESPGAAKEFLENVLSRSGEIGGRLKAADLDFSPASLQRLETALARRTATMRDKGGLVQQIAAYFGEVLRRNLGGTWSFEESSHMPVIRLDDGRVEYPVLRALKLCEDGDKLSDWFDFVAKGGERRLT